VQGSAWKQAERQYLTRSSETNKSDKLVSAFLFSNFLTSLVSSSYFMLVPYNPLSHILTRINVPNHHFRLFLSYPIAPMRQECTVCQS
jgi:hypothetical protein